MIDDMTSSDDRINRGHFFACPACHSRTPNYSDLGEEINRETRQRTLRSHVEARRGNRQSGSTRLTAGFVIEQSATRYFKLMDATFKSLDGKFTDDDFAILQNINCSPIWELNPLDLSYCVKEGHSGENSQASRALIRKLNKLSLTERLAVVEACELVWRGYVNPLI
jgi:hypothetical protein